jgi:membrane protease YdiL (CAAX protease family)
MPEQLQDPVALYFQGAALLLSLATGLVLLVARNAGPLLKFRPRRRVPWNAAGAFLACAFVVLVLLSALQKPAMLPQVETGKGAPAQDADLLIGQMVMQFVIVGGALLIMVAYFRPTRCDLGLPPNRHELAQDVSIGVITALAAVAPVFLIQYLLMEWLEMESGHELVKMLRETEAKPLVFALAAVAAVVGAPICEEITFRLLLQGWLEKWEAEALGLPTSRAPSPDRDAVETQKPDIVDTASAVSPTGNEAVATVDLRFGDSRQMIDCPPASGVAGLPFGWLPIAISSALFGLAHYGYGPEPIPLFVLALFLGYVYHRTHRIVPCIVAHAAFNSVTVFMLWRMVFYGAHVE